MDTFASLSKWRVSEITRKTLPTAIFKFEPTNNATQLQINGDRCTIFKWTEPSNNRILRGEKHFGIERISTGTASKTIDKRIQNSRRIAYALMGASFHGHNGASPEVSDSLLNIYVLSPVIHNLEAPKLTSMDYNTLEKTPEVSTITDTTSPPNYSHTCPIQSHLSYPYLSGHWIHIRITWGDPHRIRKINEGGGR